MLTNKTRDEITKELDELLKRVAVLRRELEFIDQEAHREFVKKIDESSKMDELLNIKNGQDIHKYHIVGHHHKTPEEQKQFLAENAAKKLF